MPSILPSIVARTLECSREGAGIGEGLVILFGIAVAAFVLIPLIAGAIGAMVARRYGRPRWLGFLLGSGGTLAGLVGAVALVVGLNRLDDWAERREFQIVDAWVAPIQTVEPGQVAAVLEKLTGSTPPYPYVRTRLGHELQQRLLNSGSAWTRDDLAAAAAYSPRVLDMQGTLLWLRHGLAGIEHASNEPEIAADELAIFALAAVRNCLADIPSCRNSTDDATWQRLDIAIATRIFISRSKRDEVHLWIEDVRSKVFADSPVTVSTAN